jgi:hypothetical protein
MAGGDRINTAYSPLWNRSRLCEHPFVTSQGSPYGRFRRALDNGNAMIALAAASELKTVGLTDALELVLLLLDKAPDRFPGAALRWHGRYCREVRDVDLEEAQAVLATLAGMGGRRPTAAARALAELLDRRGFERAGERLISWARR